MGSTGKLRCCVFCVAYSCVLFSCLQPAAQAATWATETVDSSGIVGIYTSIALDSSDDAHISYYDDANDDLRYSSLGAASGGDADEDSPDSEDSPDNEDFADGEDDSDSEIWFSCFIVTATYGFY